jgi:hypothetical protein
MVEYLNTNEMFELVLCLKTLQEVKLPAGRIQMIDIAVLYLSDNDTHEIDITNINNVSKGARC